MIARFLMAFVVFTVILGVNIQANAGQCGVYFKRSHSNVFPHNTGFAIPDDMTGDGVPDLILRGIDSPDNFPNKFYILPNDGNGNFGSPIIINAPSQLFFWHYPLIGDFNNDAFKDFVFVANTTPLSIIVYINNGNGTFTPQSLVNITEMGLPVMLVDINDDDIGDYIGRYNNQIRYSLGNANGTFGNPITISNQPSLFSGDFNDDGKVDFIAGNEMLTNQGNGFFTSSSFSVLRSDEDIAFVRDFTGDGKSDILTRTHYPNYEVSLLTNTGNNTFKRDDYVIGPNTNTLMAGSIHIGNFSGDGSLDFIYSTIYSNKTLVFTNDGSGSFTRQDFDYRLGGSFLGDFDNDGKTDMIKASNGVSNNTGTLQKIFPVANYTFQKNVCDRQGQTRIVDFNVSGTTDYSFWKPSTGDWTYLTSNWIDSTDAPPPQTVNWGLGSLGDIPAPGDFDGDGKTDFAVYRNSTGVWYIRRSSDLNWFVFPFGLPDDKPVVGDYDGDTISDIAVWRPSDGVWYVWLMGTQQFYAVHFGSNGDIPIPEDFDGDFKADPAVYRPSTGVWYYLKSSDGNFAAIQWGNNTDTPVPADFDGDGKAEISVYRQSDNILYILRSYDNSAAFFPYGASQDIPQPGDYNGDFVADFAIYRPSANVWYSTNYPEQINFGASNVIPTSSILRIE